jgi:hypothetical protein
VQHLWRGSKPRPFKAGAKSEFFSILLCGFLFGLREMLAHAKSDEEKEDLKGQLAELSRQTARMRRLYVHEIGVPVLFLLVFVLLAVYLIQRA